MRTCGRADVRHAGVLYAYKGAPGSAKAMGADTGQRERERDKEIKRGRERERKRGERDK